MVRSKDDEYHKDREPIGLSEGMVLIINKALVPYWLGFAIAPIPIRHLPYLRVPRLLRPPGPSSGVKRRKRYTS